MLQTGIGYMPPDKLRRLAEIYARLDQTTSKLEIPTTLRELQEQGISIEPPSPVSFTEVKEACELIDKYFEYTGGSKTVVHLGDLFVDRGACDHFMLALLKKIKEQAGEKFVILASNHGPFLDNLEHDEEQTRSAYVSLKFDPDYIRKLRNFLVGSTQLFYFDKRTNTFFTHCPITRENLKDFVEKANQVIANLGQYGLDPRLHDLEPLEIPQNDDPEKISQFVERANQYYKVVISWFTWGCRNFEDFDRKRGLLPVESLRAVLDTDIRFRYDINSNLVKPFNVTMVHGHNHQGNYSEVNDVYDLNNYAGQLPAHTKFGYWPQKLVESTFFSKDLYIYTNNAKSANQMIDTLPKSQNALNNSQQALESLTQARQALEFEKTQAEVPTLIAEFTEEWRNNRLDFNQLRQDFRSIESVLPQQSQESNDLPTLEELRENTKLMGAGIIIAAKNGNINPSQSTELINFLEENFPQELARLTYQAETIAEALENQQVLDRATRTANIAKVLRAILFDTSSRWEQAGFGLIVTGLQEFQEMQANGQWSPNVINNARVIQALVQDLIANYEAQSKLNQDEQNVLYRLYGLNAFVSHTNLTHLEPSLRNQGKMQNLLIIAKNIAQILENQPQQSWDPNQHSDNLIAIVKAIGYIIYNQQLERTQAKPENDALAEPERNYQKAIEELEKIFGAYKINLLNEVEINEAEIIAFGDAHANPMQVIYQMLHTRTGYMPPDKLRRLAEIYARIDQETSNAGTEDTIAKFAQLGIPQLPIFKDVNNEIREACKLIDEYFEYTGSPEVIHLGDLLVDRGACDDIMLALLKKIKEQAGEKFVILASNHGPFLDKIEHDYDQTRSAHVSLYLSPNYIENLGRFLVDNTQLFYFDKRTNTFFTHCPITREHLKEFVKQANQVIADPAKYGLDPNKFNFEPLEIPQSDDPEKISQFVKSANQYYKAVMSWFFTGCRNFEDFDSKRGFLPVKSLRAVVGTNIRLRDQENNPAKPFNVTMVHGHDKEGNYNEVRDVYNLNNKAGMFGAPWDIGYETRKRNVKNLYIYTNNAKSAKKS